MLYAFDHDAPSKRDIAQSLLQESPSFSSQSLSEYINVCLKRFKASKEETIQLCNFFFAACILVPVTIEIIELAFAIVKEYDYNFLIPSLQLLP